MSAIPLVQYRTPTTIAQMDALLAEADRKLAKLFANGKSWLAFDTSGVPAQQLPPWGAVYVLSADADRHLLPSPGAPNCPDGSGPWPARYDHAAMVAAAQALTVTGKDHLGVAWQTEGGFLVGEYRWGDSAAILERTVSTPDGAITMPIRFEGAYEPERFHRYAIAEVLIESAVETVFHWPHDKFGVVRVHNLSKHEVTLTLGAEQAVVVPKMGIRTLRRTGRREPWGPAEGGARHYFPPAASEDVWAWDAGTTQMGNRPLRSQGANPIFRLALLQSIFRPQVLTDGPGLFAQSILDVLPPLESSATLAEAMVQRGDLDIVKTTIGRGQKPYVYRATYSGEPLLTQPPAAWAEIGLVVSLSEAERSVVLSGNPRIGPEQGVDYVYDAIARSTNITGGVVVSLPRALRPFWTTVGEADAWFAAMFAWPEYVAQRTATEVEWWEADWEPLSEATDSDYIGHWEQTTRHLARQYTAVLTTQEATNLAPWNLFTTVLSEALPSDSVRSGSVFVRQAILTAVLTWETPPMFAGRESDEWDDATAIDPRPIPEGADDGGPGWQVAGQPFGLGWVSDDGEWIEPRWRIALLSSLGIGRTADWNLLGCLGEEEMIWTPLIPEDVGSGNIVHWRTGHAEGAADGGPVTWNTDEAGRTPAGNEPGSAAPSGMSFWRAHRPTAWTQVRTGPQPMGITDHGWLADQALQEGTAAGGDKWEMIREELHDGKPIGGSNGNSRPDEFRVGIQVRGSAATYNQLAQLINGISHVRALGWEEYAYGFRYDDLVGFLNTLEPWARFGYPQVAVHPYGCAHVYGSTAIGKDAVDAALDALGVQKRTTQSAQLAKLRTAEMRKYTRRGTEIIGWYGGIHDAPTDRPPDWVEAGAPLTWSHVEDIAEAITREGFECRMAKLVQAVDVDTVVPKVENEDFKDTIDADHLPTEILTWDFDRYSARARIESTRAVLVPTAGERELQASGSRPRRLCIAAERPMRRMMIIRDNRDLQPDVQTDPEGHYNYVIKYTLWACGPASGVVADALDRQHGEFGGRFDGVFWIPDRRCFWQAELVAPAGTSATVIAVPRRCLLTAGRQADDRGTMALTDTEPNRPLVLPDDQARTQWITLRAGERVDIARLTGTSNPPYPEKHHVWEIILTDPNLQPIDP